MKPFVNDLSSLPLILTLEEIAAVYRISRATVRKGVQNGTFSPRPYATYPYRWRRSDVQADLDRPRVEPPHKPHGFASPRMRRPKKAALEAGPTTRTAS